MYKEWEKNRQSGAHKNEPHRILTIFLLLRPLLHFDSSAEYLNDVREIDDWHIKM